MLSSKLRCGQLELAYVSSHLLTGVLTGPSALSGDGAVCGASARQLLH